MRERAVDQAAREFLEARGMVNLRDIKAVRCVHPDDAGFEQLSGRQKDCEGTAEIDLDAPLAGYTCDECGRPIEDVRQHKKQHFDYVVVESLNVENIIQYVGEAVATLPVVQDLKQEARATFRIELEQGRSLKLVVPYFAFLPHQQAGLFFNPPTAFLHLSPLEVQDWTVLERTQHLCLSVLLKKPKSEISDAIEKAAVLIEGAPELTELESELDSAIARHNNSNYEKGTYFELICEGLLKRIEKAPEKAQAYLRREKRKRQTIFGDLHIQVGGAGNTDIISIEKYALLQQLFGGSFIADAKCLQSSKLDRDQLLKVLDHLKMNEWEADRAIIFMSSSDIASNTWERVQKYRQNNDGKWLIMIIPQYLFLELMYFFEARDLFSKDMTEDETLV